MSFVHRISRGIIRWEWVLLALLYPAVYLATPEAALLLLIIPLLWAIRKSATGHLIPSTPLDVPLLVLLMMVLVSLYATFDLALSFTKVAGVIYGVAVYYAVTAAAHDTRTLWLSVAVYLLLGLGILLVSLVGIDWSQRAGIMQSITDMLPTQLLPLPTLEQGINPNEVAGVLQWVAPLALALAVAAVARAKRLVARFPTWLWLLLLAGLLVLAPALNAMLFLTGSRAGLLGWLASIIFMVAAITGSYRRYVFALLLALVIIAAGLVVTGQAPLSSFFATNELGVDSGQIDSALTSLQGRREIWTRAMYAIQDFPFTGLGMNAFRRVVPVLYPLFSIDPSTDIAHAHNHFLQAALDLGLPGLVAYVALWMGTATMLWRVWQETASFWLRTFVVGGAASLLGYTVYGLADAVALGARPGFIFWYLLGLIAAAYRIVSAGKAEGQLPQTAKG